MDQETREVLAKARRLLIEKGWCQGVAARGDDRCIMGAINEGLTGSPIVSMNVMPERNRIVLAFRTAVGIKGELADWNDAPGRTKAEVVALFDRALTQDRPPARPSVDEPVRETMRV